MVTIEVMGGLGNQLFQIFTLISYTLSNKVPFYFENKSSSRPDRPFYWDNFFLSLKSFVKSSYETNLYLYRENGFHYNQLIPYTQINKPFKLFGYFQSYKYFQANEQSIFRFIKLFDQREKCKNKYIQSYNFDNTISIHFRIGDYKHLQQHHPIMTLSYYTSALKHIIEQTGRNDWNILYFYEEEDIRIVTRNVTALQNEFNHLTFIPIDTKIVDYEQMLLMSLCQHNIIANSSFSWWGAYFNQHMNKIVTYPKNWFGPSQGSNNTDDLFPDKWSKIV